MNPTKFLAYIKPLWGVYEVQAVFRQIRGDVWPRVYLLRNTLEWEPTNYVIDGINNFLMQYVWYFISEYEEVFEWYLVKIKWSDKIREVTLNEAELQYQVWDHEGTRLPLYNSEVEEIVWNIYENPELVPE